MSASTSIVTRFELEDLARKWRTRAERLETVASSARSEGDTTYAEDLEAAAAGYRTAADEIAP